MIYQVRIVATVDETLEIEAETSEEAERIAYDKSLDSLCIADLYVEVYDPEEEEVVLESVTTRLRKDNKVAE